ncbi:MAG TPA: hypothetical protein VFJ58_17000 [Armatimonadota bacterium]|nr:hypothetical protein [Armatimonadota bacterium]
MHIGSYLLWSDVAQAVCALVLLGVLAAVLFAVIKLTSFIAKMETLMDPFAARSQEMLEKVDQTITSLESKAETMLDISEQAVRSVAAKVDTTSSLVEGAVAGPAISVRSVIVGINRGLETWRHFNASPRADGAAASAAPEPVVEQIP